MTRKTQLAMIRYNTESNGSDQCWRLIIDGKEELVESVRIEGVTFTSRDWLDEQGNLNTTFLYAIVR